MSKAALRVRAGVNRQADRNKTKGKGWRGNFRDRTTPGRERLNDEEGFLLVPGEYEDRHPKTLEENKGEPRSEAFYTRQMHRIAMQSTRKGGGAYSKTATCRKFYDGSACLACDELQKGNKRVDNGKTDQDGHVKAGYSINVIEFGLFEQVEATDYKTGETLRYENDHPEGRYKRGDPIMRWEKVEGARDRKEVLADAEQLAEDGEVRFFLKKFMDVGPSHLECLSEVDAAAAAFCKSCGQGKLDVVGFACSECDSQLIDVVQANMKSTELEEYAKGQHRCSDCGHTDYPVPQYECDNCDDPAPYRWFEVIAKLRKSGKDAQTKIVVDEVIPIDEFELPDGTLLVAMDKNDEPVFVDMDKEDPDAGFTFKLREDLANLVENQFNFEAIHKPVSNDELAKWLNVRNPYGGGSGRPGGDDEGGRSSRRSRSRYGDDDGGGSDDDENEDNDSGGGRPRRRKEPARKRR